MSLSPYLTKIVKAPLAVQVIAAVILGCAMGSIFGLKPIIFALTNEDLGQLGLLVVKALRTLATPLIFFAILEAFTKINFSMKQGGHLILICLVNVAVAMVIGLTIMNVFKPGKAWEGKLEELKIALVSQQEGGPQAAKKKADDPDAPEASLGFIKNVAYYVPSSLVKPFFYNNVISIVLLALLFGVSFRQLKRKYDHEVVDVAHPGKLKITDTLERGIEGIYDWLVLALGMVVKVVPIAVFLVVSHIVGAAGIGIFKLLWIFLAVILVGFIIHALGYYPLVAWIVGKKSPPTFLGGGSDAILTGMSINSSLGTVPLTLRCLAKMGVSPASARLSACVGTNLNNDGITLYEAMTALFIVQALGIELSLAQQLTIVLASVMAGAGIAGIPEAGLIVLPLVLSAAGLSDEMIALAIPLVLPVDVILARCRSGVNVMSDMLVAVLLDVFEPPEKLT